jgi:SOS-response transcriptional repressor LexA
MTPYRLQSIPLLGGVGASRSHDRFAVSKWRRISPVKSARPFDRYIATPVEGDSLTGDFIFDGDFVIIRLTFELEEVTPGRLVSVDTPGGVLVKHIYRTMSNQIRLVSSNERYPAIVYDSDIVQILGIIVRVERDFS